MADKIFASSRFLGNARLQDVLNGRATLKRGSQGEEVKIAQKALIDLGESMPSGVDGSFGRQSEAAVLHYQAARGLSADGIIGSDTMARLDADILNYDKPIVLKAVRFWINAFIPDPSLSPDVIPAPGASAGQSMIVIPYPNLAGRRCFLGDNRGYSNSPAASARIHALVDIINLDQQDPIIVSTDIHCDESIEINPSSGDIIARASAPADRSHFQNMRINQTVVELDFIAEEKLPLLALSRDIDMIGTLQIDRAAKSFTYKGKVDGFPCFEGWVTFDGGAPVNLFKADPIGPLSIIGLAKRPVDNTIFF
ncbi:hypothetical protein N7494_003339 [Penicillium frequentans]|uniref:Peptidoglycan binding-like domain-containing protein n=1 Tax=Penicillium frequentans TaxID=3151616 RepID=A0AAD6CZR9_9EURO|nr:hypothetical protein N7494_003339 [Penicillium glabrum]